MSGDKAVFEISPNQVEYAMAHQERYQIFRVYNAGKDNVRLVRVDNVADRLVTKNVKLYMMIWRRNSGEMQLFISVYVCVCKWPTSWSLQEHHNVHDDLKTDLC